MTKKIFLYIYLLYHILHIAMKHIGKQSGTLYRSGNWFRYKETHCRTFHCLFW